VLRACGDEQIDALQRLESLLGEVRQAQRRKMCAAAALARGERVVEDQHTGGVQPRGVREAGLDERIAADEDCGLPRRLDRARDGFEVLRSFRPRQGQGFGESTALAPRRIRRQEQERIAAGWTEACGIGGGRLRAGIRCRCRDIRPRRERLHQRLYVGGERRIEVAVIGRVIADNVDRRRKRAPCVVQVGGAVEIPRAEMQQRHRRAAGHARVAVRRASRDAFEQAQDRSDPGLPVESGDEVHLARAGLAKQVLDAALRERPDERIGTVHVSALSP
jgi:hypothetical protein